VGAIKPRISATHHHATSFGHGLGYKEWRLARLLAEGLAAMAKRSSVDCGRFFITNFYLAIGGLTEQTLVQFSRTQTPPHSLHVWSGEMRPPEVCLACLKNNLHTLNEVASQSIFKFEDAEYWDEKQRHAPPDEWYLGFSDLRQCLSKLCAGSSEKVMRVLVPGCGNSTFCEDFATEFSLAVVIGTDIATEVIKYQQARIQQLPPELNSRLTYTMDNSTSSVRNASAFTPCPFLCVLPAPSNDFIPAGATLSKF
jgi:hypothetical protein